MALLHQSNLGPILLWITQKTFNGFLLLSKNAKLPIIFLILSPTPCKTWQTPSSRAELSKHLKKEQKSFNLEEVCSQTHLQAFPPKWSWFPEASAAPLGASRRPQLPHIRGAPQAPTPRSLLSPLPTTGPAPSSHFLWRLP